jgi:hypothetical protein
MKLKLLLGLCGAVLLLPVQQAVAKVTEAEASHLGKDLTPIGAEKAGSKDGVIPEWTGGEPKRGALKGEFPNDPKVDNDKPLFTITKANMDKYADKLTAGHKELLSRYPDYKMLVYPTHRVAAFPDAIYKATEANATTCSLSGTDDLDGCKLGFPFPIPKNGAEVIWNHKLKWRGEAVRRYNNQMIVQPDGQYQLTKIIEDVKFLYASIDHPGKFENGHGEYLLYLSHIVAPPRLAGTYILVHDRGGTGNEGRVSWIYSPGIRRVRRAPSVQYDNPAEGTDGNQFYDQVDMFNGALDLYNWKILGKKDMYLPYNSNLIAGNKIKYKDLIRPHHLNQDLPRYELHRYWVVEATLKPGKSHTFKKRVFYVDEDTWNIEAVDCYDNHDQLYKFQEGHLIYAPNVLASTTVPEVIYDFQSGRYFITAAFNEDQPYDLTVNFSDDYFTPASLQRMTAK